MDYAGIGIYLSRPCRAHNHCAKLAHGGEW